MADTWSDYMREHGAEEYAAWDAAVKPYTERISALTQQLADVTKERDAAIPLIEALKSDRRGLLGLVRACLEQGTPSGELHLLELANRVVEQRDSAQALLRDAVGVLEKAHDAVVHADFQTLKEGAGAIPPETCPTINQIKDGLHDAEVLASRGWKKYDSIEDFADDVGRALYDLEAQLEHVRRANGDLRDLGKYWHDTAKELWSAEEDALERVNAFLSRPDVKAMGGGK